MRTLVTEYGTIDMVTIDILHRGKNMLTGEIKNKVDQIWETFWTGGVTNPLTVIEQFTYLIFIKSLDDKQLQREAEANLLGIEPVVIFDEPHEDLRWHHFKEFEAEKMHDTVANKVFPFIKNMNGDANSSFAKYMSDAMFQIPTPQMLQRVEIGRAHV